MKKDKRTSLRIKIKFPKINFKNKAICENCGLFINKKKGKYIEDTFICNECIEKIELNNIDNYNDEI